MAKLTVAALLLLSAHSLVVNAHIIHPYYNSYSDFLSPFRSPAELYTNSIHNYAPIEASPIPQNYYSPYSHAYHYNHNHNQLLSPHFAAPPPPPPNNINVLPQLNLLAQAPYTIDTQFTTVPLLVVAQENLRMVEKATIMGISQQRPTMQVKTDRGEMLQCTPAVRVVLQEPLLVQSLKANIIFPARIAIVHDEFRIPINVGAVIAPISENTFVSYETPISIKVVYAIPTDVFQVDVLNTTEIASMAGAMPTPGGSDSVVVDGAPSPAAFGPHNITIISFPEREAEPSLTVDEEDDELVNRNPPVVLAPAGIVQSTQPEAIVEAFSNSKESPILIALREEALKQRQTAFNN